MEDEIRDAVLGIYEAQRGKDFAKARVNKETKLNVITMRDLGPDGKVKQPPRTQEPKEEPKAREPKPKGPPKESIKARRARLKREIEELRGLIKSGKK